MSLEKVKFNATNREILISEVQLRPSLWNDQHPEYKKTDKTTKLWDEVGAVVGFPGKVLKSKWKNIKDKFRIELNKVPVQRSGEEHVEYKSKWHYFEMMFFIKDSLLPSSTTGNLQRPVEPHSIPCSDEETVAAIEDDEEISEAEQPETLASTSVTRHTSRRNFLVLRKGLQRAKKSTGIWRWNKKKLDLFREEQKKESELTTKPDYQFLLSLLPYLEELDTLQKLEVRGKIQEVVIEAYRLKKKETTGISQLAAIQELGRSQPMEVQPIIHYQLPHTYDL